MIRGDGYRRPTRSLRVVLAAALTLGALAVLGGTGSLSYAASGVSEAVQSAVHVVTPAQHATPKSPVSSAQAQYRVAYCLRGHTIYHDSRAANGMRRAGATPGQCTGKPSFTPNSAAVVMACFKGQNIKVNKRDLAALKKLGFKKGFCKK